MRRRWRRACEAVTSFIFRQYPTFEESCPDRSLRARWRRALVAVGLGRAFERIGRGLCRLSRIGGSVRCQVVGGRFAGGR